MQVTIEIPKEIEESNRRIFFNKFPEATDDDFQYFVEKSISSFLKINR